MLITEADKQFLAEPFHSIEGWCVDEPAWLTTYLLRLQQSENRVAPCFEIGVYKGRYFSVLVNGARAANQDVIGFDTFAYCPIPVVEETVRVATGSLEGVRFVQGDSTKMSTADLSEQLGGRKAAFCSVDGGHTPAEVLSDLLLSESVLEPWGIVSVDDFYNPMAIGVTEGVMRFWLQHETNLDPIAYCRNKLLAVNKEFAAYYSNHVLQFSEENQHLPFVKVMLDHKNLRGLHWAKQEFLGRQVWIL